MSQIVSSIKPQDIAVIVKLGYLGKKSWRQIDLALELELSQGEVAKSLSRLEKLGLIHDKKINKAACLEFLIHGLKYVFPQIMGPLTLGIATGLSCLKHQEAFANGAEGDVYVWPSIDGKIRGQMIQPLYDGLAKAALKDQKFYEMMSAIEILRMGRARERSFAEDFIKKEIRSA